MFDMYATAPSGGDCTAPYAVVLDKEYTVQEFINAVLTKSDEWGYIGIETKNIYAVYGEPYCEYSHGKLLTELPKDILNKKVVSARAHGGWTLMHYFLKIT